MLATMTIGEAASRGHVTTARRVGDEREEGALVMRCLESSSGWCAAQGRGESSFGVGRGWRMQSHDERESLRRRVGSRT